MASQQAGRWIQTINPTTGKPLRKFRTTTRVEVGRTVDRARKAFGEWLKLPVSKRAVYLDRAAKTLRARKDKLARLMTVEMGKTIRESTSEVAKSAWALEYYAQNGEKFLAPEAAKTDATDSYVAFEPLGVIASIMPWNFPIWQCVRFAAPALLAGNCVVFKPSSVSPHCGLALQEVFETVGLPSYLFNTVLGGSDVARFLIESDAAGVSFTGSVEAGRAVASAAGANLKKLVLELGGSDPFIVLDDADVEAASSAAVVGRFLNCGQSCIASKRFFVQDPVYDEFLELFLKKTRGLVVGDPLRSETDVGPMVREEALDALDSQVKDSVKAGADVVTGGDRIERRGFFYAPTILTKVKPAMRVMKEETFGPVAPLMTVKNDAEAVEAANATEFGLGACVWGRDVRRAEKLARSLSTGLVTVNNVVVSDPRVPFGGVKNSGFGRELSKYGLLEFTNIKTVRVYEKSPLPLSSVE